jgi:nitroreductase
MDIHQLIQNRRSVYPEMFTTEIIEENLLLKALEHANFAPTHRLTEPWRFRIVAGDAKSKLAEILANWYKSNTNEADFSEIKYKKTAAKVLKSSHIVAICMQRDPKATVPEWEEIAATAMAVQNIWLSAWDLGIGMYWGSPKAIHSEAIRQFLELGEGETCLGFLYMGMMPEGLELKAVRRPMAEKIKWV